MVASLGSDINFNFTSNQVFVAYPSPRIDSELFGKPIEPRSLVVFYLTCSSFAAGCRISAVVSFHDVYYAMFAWKGVGKNARLSI